MFFVLGNFNNSSYVIITAASQDVAERFGQSDLVGYVLMSLWIFSGLIKICNCTCWIK